MFSKKSLLTVLIILNISIAYCAQVAFNTDLLHYLAKASCEQTLKNQTGTVFVQTSNLATDLNTLAIADYFNCKTVVGKEFLKTALNLPISPKSACNTIACRQNLIKALVHNPALKEQVDSLIQEFANLEAYLQNFFTQEFIAKFCPESLKKKLTSKKRWTDYLIARFCPESLKKKLLSKTRWRRYKALIQSLTYSGTATSFFWGSSKISYLMAKALIKNDILVNDQPASFNQQLAFGGLWMCAAGLSALEFYELIKCAKFHYKDYKSAFDKRNYIHAIYKMTLIANQLDLLCAQNSLTTQFGINTIADQASLNLMRELEKPRYAQAKALVFLIPEVHALTYEIYKQEGCLSSIFAAVAEIDACNVISTKLLETQELPNQFCFTQFLDQAKIQIKSTGNWNVLVGEHFAVANDFSENKNVILSGVNAGGKTTFIRTLLQNILLSQTFGVAAGTSFIFTPFDMIESYLNLSDDLMNGQSLFVSEVKRAQKIKAKTQSIAGTNLKYFFALDELFTGTGASAGEQCAYGFVNKIAQSNQAMFIYSTHFNDIKDLANSHVNCTNYKTDTAIKLNDGSLQYPFTISKGASYDSAALDIANNANLFD